MVSPVGASTARSPRNAEYIQVLDEYAVSRCEHCRGGVFWQNELLLIHPVGTTAPLAYEDMPLDLAADFEEARQVFPRSARASPALLRLLFYAQRPWR